MLWDYQSYISPWKINLDKKEQANIGLHHQISVDNYQPTAHWQKLFEVKILAQGKRTWSGLSKKQNTIQPIRGKPNTPSMCRSCRALGLKICLNQ